MGVYLNFIIAIFFMAQPLGISTFSFENDKLDSEKEIDENLSIENNLEVKVYPKISTLDIKDLNVIWKGTDEKVSIMITDVFDKILYNRYASLSGRASNLDISNLDEGVYKLKIRDGKQEKTLKFVRIE